MRPTVRLVWLLAAGFPLALLPVALAPRWWTVWVAFLSIVALLAGLDVLLGLSHGGSRCGRRPRRGSGSGSGRGAPVALRPTRAGATRLGCLLDLAGDVLPAPEQAVLLAQRPRSASRSCPGGAAGCGSNGSGCAGPAPGAGLALAPPGTGPRGRGRAQRERGPGRGLRLFSRRAAPAALKVVRHVGEGASSSPCGSTCRPGPARHPLEGLRPAP